MKSKWDAKHTLNARTLREMVNRLGILLKFILKWQNCVMKIIDR